MTDLVLEPSEVPESGASLNPFVVVEDAAGLVDFVCATFGAVENVAARTPMPDGRLIHAEVVLGGSKLLLADPSDGWAACPGLLQIWVRDVVAVLERATALGATVVTPATPFYGETTLARMSDPWGNLWWLYAPAPGQRDPRPSWAGGSDAVFRTVDAAMKARALTDRRPLP